MRPLWKGAITFGLVNIPIALYSATSRQELSFRLLHAKDQSPISYKRFCEAEGLEVPWSEIVKGYEYDKGQFVVMTDDDFDEAAAEATGTIDIRDFVPTAQIPPLYFEQPYYVEPTQTGVRAYALLREALVRSGRVGIARFVLRQREHLALLGVSGDVLLLTTMRFADEIVAPTELNVPRGEAALDRREIDLGVQLVDTLAADWEPARYHDEYRASLMRAIEQKLEGKPITPTAARKPPTKVVDLVSALRESLKASAKRATPRKPAAAVSGKRAPARRRAS